MKLSSIDEFSNGRMRIYLVYPSQPYMERDLAIWLFLETVQLWAFCQTVSQHGNGYCICKGNLTTPKFHVDLIKSQYLNLITLYVHHRSASYEEGIRDFVDLFYWVLVRWTGDWHRLDNSSWHWWIVASSWSPGILRAAVASQYCCRRWYGGFPQLCESSSHSIVLLICSTQWPCF